MTNHGALTEPSLSLHGGKGREGKGREVGHPSIVSTGSGRPGFDFRGRPLDGRRWMAADAEQIGGRP